MQAIELTGEKAKLLVEKDQLFDRFRSLRDRFNQVCAVRDEQYV